MKAVFIETAGLWQSRLELRRGRPVCCMGRDRPNGEVRVFLERDQLDAQPAVVSVALQRQRIGSVVDDWLVMTDEEKKQVVRMIFAEIRANHTADGLRVEFRARAAWEPTSRRSWRLRSSERRVLRLLQHR
jgi:hypothetical protein